MAYERNDNGVKIRSDGAGDGWADAHRSELPKCCHFGDFDGIVGKINFVQNGQEKLFVEYVCDPYVNAGKLIRKFGYLALFDRKANERVAFGSQGSLGTAVYLETCRRLSAGQPIPCRFFFVIGTNEGPWTIAELDTATGERLNSNEIIEGQWKDLWTSLGLWVGRQQLEKWAAGK